MSSSQYVRALFISLLAISSTATAQFTINPLSFGHTSTLSPDYKNIAGFAIGGDGHEPTILSDRIVLTPPAPGNKRGGIWAEHAITYPEWEATSEFRTSGPERGSGNMQIWLTRDVSPMQQFRSVYTVDRFDGLVLQIDQYGGMGGSVRGFLSDGSISYKNHHNVDGLAFGHCDYAYRNLGRMSKITIRQDQGGFHVKVDDKECFSSNEIRLPTGYFFGITAASAENPDSFEVSNFIVSTLNSITREQPGLRGKQSRPDIPSTENQPAAADGGAAMPPPPAQTDQQQQQQQDQPTSGGRLDSEQMGQILSLLQSLSGTVRNLNEDVTRIKSDLEAQRKELTSAVSEVPSHFPHGDISEIKRRVDNIESTVVRIKNDIEGRDYKEHLTGLQEALRDTRESLMSGLPNSMQQIITTSAPSMWLVVFILIAVQLLLAGSYVVYKKRRANAPKKFL